MTSPSHPSRRALALGLGGAGIAMGFGAASPAWAQAGHPRAVQSHPQNGRRSADDANFPGAPWARGHQGLAAPLDAPLITTAGERSLGEVLAGRPGVVNLWATWCPPCIAEKPALNGLAIAMRANGDSAAILSVLCFDNAVREREEIDKAYQRFGASALAPLRATPAAEVAFLTHFGASGTRARPAMPSTMLLDAEGRERGRIRGAAMLGPTQNRSYWSDPSALELLLRMASPT